MAEMLGRFEVQTLPAGWSIYIDPKPHRYYAEIKPSKSAEGGYSYVQGSNLAGVSTVAKGLADDPDPLIHWGVDLEHEGICKLAGEGPIPTDPEALKAQLGERELRWYQRRQQMADEGNAVHRVFLALAADREPSLSDLSAKARGYGQGAMRWWWDRQPTPILAETVTADLATRIAGRFDLLCETENGRELVDAKRRESGKDRRSDHVQTQGYEQSNLACGIGPSDRQIVLLLLPDGSYCEIESVATPGMWAAAMNSHVLGKSLDKAMREGRKERV